MVQTWESWSFSTRSWWCRVSVNQGRVFSKHLGQENKWNPTIHVSTYGKVVYHTNKFDKYAFTVIKYVYRYVFIWLKVNEVSNNWTSLSYVWVLFWRASDVYINNCFIVQNVPLQIYTVIVYAALIHKNLWNKKLKPKRSKKLDAQHYWQKRMHFIHFIRVHCVSF